MGSLIMHIIRPCNNPPTKVISHTFKSRQQDIKDALLVGWFALMSVLTICVPNQQFADPPTNVLIWNEIGYR